MANETIITCILLVFIIAGCLFLNQYLLNISIERFSQGNNNNNNNNNNANFYFFSMKGCPHCTNVDKSGEFKKLANEYSPKQVNGTNVTANNIEIARTANNQQDIYMKDANGNRIPGADQQAKKIYNENKP